MSQNEQSVSNDVVEMPGVIEEPIVVDVSDVNISESSSNDTVKALFDSQEDTSAAILQTEGLRKRYASEIDVRQFIKAKKLKLEEEAAERKKASKRMTEDGCEDEEENNKRMKLEEEDDDAQYEDGIEDLVDMPSISMTTLPRPGVCDYNDPIPSTSTAESDYFTALSCSPYRTRSVTPDSGFSRASVSYEENEALINWEELRNALDLIPMQPQHSFAQSGPTPLRLGPPTIMCSSSEDADCSDMEHSD